ncbi:MAG: autoinducer(acylhomoserine lactone) synthesis protein [Alphaproteobacteria bacterium]|nr:MAG: autoinducer(acylhomoserine lactone) synthesis protein [Caulobacteraceae bacterium]TPW06627.1 MAG: autoinducer(acylhomoserine lactone) synthesis protein [Alphaproteobacteria bacterium]
MRVHVVNSANRSQYLDEIEAMHRHRHRLFVELMGWRALASDDGLDIDEFDNQWATYLLAIDDDGVLRGSGRLVPSWRPHMLKNLFPEFSDTPAPVGPEIWEWTRHAPGDPLYSGTINKQVKSALHIGMLEFAASRGIEAFTGILETRLLGPVIESGWKITPLGAPRDYGEGNAVGVVIRFAPDFIDIARARAGRSGPVLVEMPCGMPVDARHLARRSVELAMRLPLHALGEAVARLEPLVAGESF